MKTETAAVEIHARLVLNRRELQLLHHLFSFDNKKDFAKGVAHSSYGGGVTAKEAEDFMDHIHTITGLYIDKITEQSKLLFAGS